MGFDIPINITAISTSAQAIPTKTPYIDFDTGKIQGYCTDNEAMKQAIKLALLTPRFRFLIYDGQYGSEVESIVGKSYNEPLFQTEAKRCVKEALLADSRITDVYDFEFESDGEEVTIRFSVDTVFGAITEQEVNLSV